MRGQFGEHFKLTIFGESHGPAIGMVIDGIPAGTAIDEAEIARHMARRAPGNDPTATARKEADHVRIVSGLLGGRATGAPLCGLIENTNTRSGDYAQMSARMRPGHADYAGYVKYRRYKRPARGRALFRAAHRAAGVCREHRPAAAAGTGCDTGRAHRRHCECAGRAL